MKNPGKQNVTIRNVGSEEIPEIVSKLKQMKNKKTSDRITREMLRAGKKLLREAIRILLNKCLFKKIIENCGIHNTTPHNISELPKSI